MDRDRHSEAIERTEISPLTKDKTYGERMYNRIFDVGVNFWVNLLLSGAFTFWVKHYEKPIWGEGTFLGDTLGIGNKWAKEGVDNLGKLHQNMKEALADGKFLKSPAFGLKTEELRTKRAESIVNVFTLQTPGHFIMIPSITLGAKYKAGIVKYFNRKHYGDEAMHSPDLVARHHAIAMEERPTVLGAIMGRLGGMAINMGLSSFIGSEDNLVNKAGVKRFNGIDPTAGKVGEHMGNMAKDISPEAIRKTNAWFGRNGFDQNAGVNDLGRFLAQDVMYTISTSSTIHPVVNFLRKHLPGMTYTPKPPHDPEFENLPRVRVPRHTFASEAEPIDTHTIADTHDARKAPGARISHTTHEATLTPRPEQAMVHQG